MTAEREALRSALERVRDRFKLAVAGKPVRDMAETLAEVDQALANPATIRDTDEDAEPFTYAYRYPSFPPKGATVIRFGTHGREINGSKPIEAIPLYRRLASSTPAEPREASGYCPFCMTADPVSRA